MWEQELVELKPASFVSNDHARLGEGTHVQDSEPGPREIVEAVRRRRLQPSARGRLVAALCRGKRVTPAGNPREPFSVIDDLGPPFAKSALRPPDGEHLRVAEDVRRVLAPTEAPELERLLGEA